MKRNKIATLTAVTILCLASCNNRNQESHLNPFDNISTSENINRDKILIISDLHLGNDLSYSETVTHLERLKEFLKEVRSSNTVKELIMNGDILDEWYIPTRSDTYSGGTQADFVRKSVESNKEIFDELNSIIRDGKIKVTYIPGNHDMGFTPENIDIAMPGVNQARDTDGKFPLGTYNPEDYPQIAIEHGHRYDFFCAMTPGANESDAPGAILAPGYFFARIAANSFVNPTTPEAATKVPEVKLNDAGDPEQMSKYIYYGLWKTVIENVIYVKDDFSEPIIKTNLGNYTKTYSINDIIPRNNPLTGKIEMNLYDGLFTQDNWDTRAKYNNVPVMTKIDTAIVGSLKTKFIDDMSQLQYFDNSSSDTRIVVFGHTHKPMIKSSTNSKGEICIYVNSGTWEDHKTRDKYEVVDQDTINMHFVLITPTKAGHNHLQIGLYQYRNGNHFKAEAMELSL